jgi:hypothetical protein
VDPRPPLPYEIQQYAPWHRRRILEAKPGDHRTLAGDRPEPDDLRRDGPARSESMPGPDRSGDLGSCCAPGNCRQWERGPLTWRSGRSPQRSGVAAFAHQMDSGQYGTQLSA